MAWAGEHAVRLDSLDRHQTPRAAFSFLDAALDGKRVVFLGESDHFVAERMEFRLLLIGELAKRGYRRIGMEMGASDAKRIDHYLATGDETWLERVALYGYRGDLRTDRKDEIPGWTDDAQPEFTRIVMDEAKWFVRQLRKINEELPAGEPRISWFGYDVSFRPGGGYADAEELLDRHADAPLALGIKKRLARVPGESRLEEIERLEKTLSVLDANRDAIVSLLGEKDARELRRSIQRMADSFRFIDGLQGVASSDPKAVLDTLRRRERRMDRNFDDDLAEWPPDEKIILLGHALHLSKDSESIVTQSYGQMWKSIGTYLTGKLPGKVYGIWLLHDHGRHGQPRATPLIRPFQSPSGSVERLFKEIHPIFMLPLGSGDPREAWLQEERTFSISGSPARAILPRQTDCLFFIETAHEPGKRVQPSPKQH